MASQVLVSSTSPRSNVSHNVSCSTVKSAGGNRTHNPRLRRPIRAIPTNYSILEKPTLFNELRHFSASSIYPDLASFCRGGPHKIPHSRIGCCCNANQNPWAKDDPRILSRFFDLRHRCCTRSHEACRNNGLVTLSTSLQGIPSHCIP